MPNFPFPFLDLAWARTLDWDLASVLSIILTGCFRPVFITKFASAVIACNCIVAVSIGSTKGSSNIYVVSKCIYVEIKGNETLR